MRTGWNDRGISSVVMLTTLLPLLVVAGTLLSVESAHLRETESVEARARARAISSGGAHDAIARLQADPAFSGTFTVALDAGTAVVTVVACDGDGVDNDRNGRVDDESEIDLVSVRSEGLLGFEVDVDGDVLADHGRNWRGLTEVMLRRTRLDATFDSALYVDDPLASLRFSGTAFLISGYDADLEGDIDRDEPHAAIGTPGDPSTIRSRFPRSQRNKVVGQGGLPSVHEVTELDLQELLETFGPLATINWKDGESTKGSIGDRDALDPVIAHAAGDLHLSGRTTGCGILLVEGDLEIAGSFDFVGIVVVGGSLQFRGGGNRALLGTVLTGGNIDYPSQLKGSMTIQFSSAAIDAVRSVGDGFEVVAWRQG